MSKIEVQCARCSTKFAVKASLAGRKAVCSKCGHKMDIPTVAPRVKGGSTGFALLVGGLVVVIALAAGVFFVFVYEPAPQPASDDPFAAAPEDIVAPSASAQTGETSAPIGKADDAMAIVAGAIDAISRGDVDGAVARYLQPLPAEGRAAIEAQIARIDEGELQLEPLEAAARGRWGMVVLRVVETSVVDVRTSLAEQWLIHRNGKWHMVHNESFSSADIMMAMDGNFDALAGWFNSNSDALAKRYIEQAVVKRELTGIEPAVVAPMPSPAAPTRTASTDEPDADKPASSGDKDALRDLAEEAFTAANEGDYDKANELLDVTAVADGDAQAWWDKMTDGKSLIGRAIRTRRIHDNDDGSMNVMLRSRKQDGTVFTIIVDVKF